MKSATMYLETLTCPSCMQKIEGALKGVEGVQEDTINVSFNSSRVRFDFQEDKTSIDEIEDVVTRVGYEVKRSRVK